MHVRKVYMQHGSLVVNVPKPIAKELNIERGDHVCFTLMGGELDVLFGKIVALKGYGNADKNDNPVKNKCRSARSKIPIRRGKDERARRISSKKRADSADHSKRRPG